MKINFIFLFLITLNNLVMLSVPLLITVYTNNYWWLLSELLFLPFTIRWGNVRLNNNDINKQCCSCHEDKEN